MLRGINPGELDVLLTVEQKIKTKNNIGEIETTYSTYKQVFGKRTWKPSNEKIEAKEPTSSDDVEFLVRYDAGLNAEMRFKQEQETTYFYITDIRSSRREGTTIINAERRDNQ